MTSSAKRRRTEERSSTSVTSKLTAQSTLPSTSAVTPGVVSATEGERAAIHPYTQCIPRVSVLEFFYTNKHKDERDLFLQAMNAMMNNPHTDDPWSYYAIAGIHGLPQKEYDSAPSPIGRGYCEHGTVLFPTWHRPYILLFEQAVIRAAVKIANELKDAAKDKCLQIANSLRVPYLDWESSFTAYQGLPDVFTRLTIDITYPHTETTTIPNPLRSYVLPVDLSKPISASDVFNPTAKPNYQIPETLTPFTPASYPTVRHPDATYQSSTDALNLSVQRSCNLMLRPQLFAAMLQTDWAKFSNHYSNPVDGKGSSNKHFYGHYASIEVVHDAFHDGIGGQGGHMSYPDSK